MAALIGYLQGNRGRVHRLGSRVIDSRLATWRGEIDTTLTKDGKFFVSVNGKQIAEGNVNEHKCK